MGLTMESLKEAMKYMLESQGFDRVLRKVRALGGQGSGSAAPAAQLVCAAFCAPRNKGLNRDQGHGTAPARRCRCFPHSSPRHPDRAANTG